jgi:HPt (histidine-containing phosphotransfer) domain-containing protein
MMGIEQANDIPRLDEIKFNELKNILGNEVRDIIAEFSKTAPEALSMIAASLQSNDAERVFVQAHTLKSSSAVIGLSRFSRLCAILEAQARKNEMVKPESQLQLLHDELPIGIAELNKMF